MRTGSTVYPSERNNYSTAKNSDTDSDGESDIEEI